MSKIVDDTKKVDVHYKMVGQSSDEEKKQEDDELEMERIERMVEDYHEYFNETNGFSK